MKLKKLFFVWTKNTKCDEDSGKKNDVKAFPEQLSQMVPAAAN